MPDRDLPVRPDLTQLRHQAKDLLRAIRRLDPSALADLHEHHPRAIEPAGVKLADAQLVLARSYHAPSWNRLVLSCQLIDAIWHDDVDAVRALVTAHPMLIHEPARIRQDNWGPPMSYAANLGRDRIITMLHRLGATDLDHALDRAALQSRIGTARMLHELMGRPAPSSDALGGPAYTLSDSGTALLFELGAKAVDEIDLLEAHLARDPALLRRTFSHEEIYPPALGCHDEVLATHGTPLGGATLLHMCVDYDEMEIARWLISRGMDVNAKASIDQDGFGGHTALFSTVVSQANFWTNRKHGTQSAPFTELLLEQGADPNARASLRKQLHPGYGPSELQEYRDVTPLSWGQRFHARMLVSESALRVIAAHGGLP
jgi:hypothetical protein